MPARARQLAELTVGLPAYCVTVPGCGTAVTRNGWPALCTAPPFTAVLLRLRALPAVVQLASAALTVRLLGRIAKLSVEQLVTVGEVVGHLTRTRTSRQASGTAAALTVERPLLMDGLGESVWTTAKVTGQL